VIDRIVPEPLGGAHRAPAEAIFTLGNALDAALRELDGRDRQALMQDRRAKFLAMGRS